MSNFFPRISKDWLIWSLPLLAALIGVAVVANDVQAKRAKKQILALKLEADLSMASRDYARAALLYNTVKGRGQAIADDEVLLAAGDAGHRLIEIGNIEAEEDRLLAAKQKEEEDLRLATEASKQIIVKWFAERVQGNEWVEDHIGHISWSSGGIEIAKGSVCGRPLGNGKICRNRVIGGGYCYLHRDPSPGYSSTVHFGPRGGVYHYSKNGKKVYHKR